MPLTDQDRTVDGNTGDFKLSRVPMGHILDQIGLEQREKITKVSHQLMYISFLEQCINGNDQKKTREGHNNRHRLGAPDRELVMRKIRARE